METLEGFFKSCEEGILSEVETFLREGLSLNVQNAEGETALQISAANGYMDIIIFLLNKGASVNLANNYGWTPLMHAARHGHFEVVSLLIRRKAKININSRLGVRPIDIAAWYGNLSCLKLIIEAGTIIDNIPLIGLQNDFCDISPLMVASLQGHTDILKKLLEEGSFPNQASAVTGLTPLMLASCNGYETIVEILIEHGSDANLTDICGRTALDLATICCRENVVIFLKNVTQQILLKSASSDSQDNIIRVVRSGDITKVKSLLQKNKYLSNYIDPEDGVTPLMIASMVGPATIVDLLISCGADLNSQDKINGWTPLMYAVFHRQAEIVHLLLDRGVDIYIYTSNGYSALDLALHIDSSETDIFETLLELFGTEELLDTDDDYLDTSFGSSIKQSHLDAQMPTSKSDSQAKFKDLLGGFSSHFRQFSRSSAVSPTVDFEVADETLNDVFPDENTEKPPTNKKFLCLSKFYAPNERFSHLLKEQKEKAINLSPLPSRDISVGLNTASIKKDLTSKSTSTKPHFNSLRVPNLLRRMKEDSSVDPNNDFKKDTFSESTVQEDISNFSAISTYNLKPDSTLQSKDDAVLKESNEDFESTLEGTMLKNISGLNEETLTNFSKINSQDPKSDSNKEGEVAAEGLTALLDRESLRKYVEKFRDQEIDLETFKYLTEEDLDEIGINSFDSRYKLMEIIDKLKDS